MLIIVIVCLILKFNWFAPQHLSRPSGPQKIRGEPSAGADIVAVLPKELGLLQIRSNIRGVLSLWHGNLRVRPRMQDRVGLPLDGLVRAPYINYNFPVIPGPKPIRRQRLLLLHLRLSLYSFLDLAQVDIIYLLFTNQCRMRNLTNLLQRHFLLILFVQFLRNSID